MIGAIIIILFIGALYQWRHTDFVKAILVVLVLVIFGLIGLLVNDPSFVVPCVLAGGIFLYHMHHRAPI
jgi:hypothetical protein